MFLQFLPIDIILSFLHNEHIQKGVQYDEVLSYEHPCNGEYTKHLASNT